MLKLKKTRLAALFAVLLAIVPLFWTASRWRTAHNLKLAIDSISHARSLAIEGQFYDYDDYTKKEVSVIITNETDIAALASLFQSATPKLDLEMSWDFAHGHKLGTFVGGTIKITSDTATTEIRFLSGNLLIGNDKTTVRLDGFSSKDIYATLKKRGLL